MNDTDPNTPSRRDAMQQLAAGASLAAMGVTPAVAQTRPNSTPEDFVRLQKQLSNWNRWGADDQMGAVNLITPAKRQAAARLVREGASFSLARNAEIKEAVDNPAPIQRKTTRTGASVSKTGIASTSGVDVTESRPELSFTRFGLSLAVRSLCSRLTQVDAAGVQTSGDGPFNVSSHPAARFDSAVPDAAEVTAMSKHFPSTVRPESR